MKIVALVKQVPDTETKIKLRDGGGIDEAGIKYVVNPYDEFAVEESLKLKEKIGAELVIVSMGPARVVEAIRTCLAMGADRGIHVENSDLVTDSLMTATILAAVLKKENPNLVMCGKQAVDYDTASVVPMTAELMGWAHVMIVEKFELRADQKGATVYRRIGGGSKEVIEVDFPAFVGCEKGLNTPRYPSLPGIMKAKQKPLETLKAKELLGSDQRPKIEILNYRLPPERKAGKMIPGDASQAAVQLVKLLREEAKVI